MPSPKMSWQFSADVPNMASVQVVSSPIEIEAVDQFVVPVKEVDDTTTAIGIQPSSGNPIKLLVIKSSSYANHITFTFSEDEDGSNPSEEISLTAPQIFTESVMKALYKKPPKFVQVTYATGDPIDISIYVVRDATPNHPTL